MHKDKDRTEEDIYWMQHALRLAHKAEEMGEVPVGAVIVKNQKLIAEGWNRPIESNDPTAHAEIIALREAGKTLENYRLENCKLYVTLEPCLMCAAAMVHARIKRVCFGARDTKTGIGGSALAHLPGVSLNHDVFYEGGILADECSLVVNRFFLNKRL